MWKASSRMLLIAAIVAAVLRARPGSPPGGPAYRRIGDFDSRVGTERSFAGESVGDCHQRPQCAPALERDDGLAGLLAVSPLRFLGRSTFLAGRFVWILVFAMLLVTYPVRKWFAPLPALASSAAPGMTGPAPYPPPFPPLPRQAPAEVKPCSQAHGSSFGRKSNDRSVSFVHCFHPNPGSWRTFLCGDSGRRGGLAKGRDGEWR